MDLLALIKAFLIALPELVKLVQTLQAMQDENAMAIQIKKDLVTINDAFQKKDPDALRALFNS